MKRRMVVPLVAVFCMVLAGCVHRQYRYYSPTSKNRPGAVPPPAPTPGPLAWHPATDPRFVISGLPFWQENPGKWQRLPDRAQGRVPEAVWNLSQMPSGGRIRFRSDTTQLAVRVAWPSPPGMRNMHAFGQAGIDCYLDGQYKTTLAPRKDLDVTDHLFMTVDKSEREITLYLPLYLGVTVKEIGVDADATLLPPTPFALEKPVVFYGTSITQGGCASHPGMSYEALLGRRLNLDFVNLGFSGAGKGEKEVAQLVAEIDASCFVVDMAQNNPSAEDLDAHFGPLLDILRARHPDTPILCTTPIYMSTELPGASTERNLPAMRDVVRRSVEQRRVAGDRKLYLVEGNTLLGPKQGDGFVDGVHPNDLGFYFMANGFEPHLRKILKLH